MEDDHPVMSRPNINKFVILQSMRELQSKRSFDTLEALSEAISEDLFEDGFSLGPEERAKVARIVDEEGYTGRFAIDDILKRKFKNKKWLPVASVVLAVAAFFLSSAVAAVIEHYVQKPLDTNRPSAPLTAIFQVPDKVGDLLAFKVKVTNVSGEPLTNIVLFASAGEVSQQFKVDSLGKGESQTVSGFLNLASEPEGELDFVAYLIAGDFSLCSESTKVAREPSYVAVADGPQSAAPAAKRMAAAQESASPSGRQSAGPISPQSNAQPSTASQDGLSVPPSVVGDPGEPSRVLSNQQLDSKSEVLRLAGKSDPVSRALLKAYAEAGDQQALRLLQEQKP